MNFVASVTVVQAAAFVSVDGYVADKFITEFWIYKLSRFASLHLRYAEYLPNYHLDYIFSLLSGLHMTAKEQLTFLLKYSEDVNF